MIDAISDARLSEVHPKLAERVRSMVEILAGQSIDVRVTQALRSWDQQLALWQQGRDAQGNIVEAAKVVTHAAPGHSYHNFGLAVDVAPFDDGIPDWNANHPVWKQIEAVGESVGLTAGAEWRTFPDAPHFQLTGFLPVSPDDGVRQAYQDGGIDAVWAETGLEAG